MIFLFAFILFFAIVLGIVAYKSRRAGIGFVSSGNNNRFWKQAPPTHRDHQPAVRRTDFRAVSIQCGPDCCQAATKFAGKRGFPSQMPRLPLSQCDAEKCTCTYQQHNDRRLGDDRRNLYASIINQAKERDERRFRFDRRCDSVEEGLQDFNFSQR